MSAVLNDRNKVRKSNLNGLGPSFELISTNRCVSEAAQWRHIHAHRIYEAWKEEKNELDFSDLRNETAR